MDCDRIMKKIELNAQERKLLFKQAPQTEGGGGFQKLLVRLQRQYDSDSKEIKLYKPDLEKIGRYAYKYNKGGWQKRLVSIFGRHLGIKLGWKKNPK